MHSAYASTGIVRLRSRHYHSARNCDPADGLYASAFGPDRAAVYGIRRQDPWCRHPMEGGAAMFKAFFRPRFAGFFFSEIAIGEMGAGRVRALARPICSPANVWNHMSSGQSACRREVGAAWPHKIASLVGRWRVDLHLMFLRRNMRRQQLLGGWWTCRPSRAGLSDSVHPLVPREGL